MNNQPCPMCGVEMQHGYRTLTLTYKDQSSTFDMPGWYCANCGEGVHTGKDMQESDRQLNLLKAKVECLVVPDEVRRIRKKLELSQAAAGQLLGGGPNAFNKYERGLILPSQAVSSLLRVLDAKPEAVSVLRDAQSGSFIASHRGSKRTARRPPSGPRATSSV